MDKTNLKQAQKDKKANSKDRGDLNKDKNMNKEPNVISKPKFAQSGGDEVIAYKSEIKNGCIAKTRDEVTNSTERSHPKDDLIAKIVKLEQTLAQKREKITEEASKKAKDKRAIKPKNISSKVVKRDDMHRHSNEKDSVKSDQTKIGVKNNDESQDSKSLPINKNPNRRRPVVKTVTKTDDSKIYKEVSFVNEKAKLKTLHVNIPVTYNPKTSATSTESNTAKTKANSKERNRIKGVRKRNYVTSPDPCSRLTPTTEVSKWTSPSANTKSFHEAWVKTTLEAMSRSKKNDKLYLEKKQILGKFQRSLSERPTSPELYDFNDERYTGRIRVKQR
ncbi:hypothetical protein ACJJTC_001698 [Scirpophaga incertulas]